MVYKTTNGCMPSHRIIYDDDALWGSSGERSDRRSAGGYRIVTAQGAPVPDSPLLNNFHDSTNADHDRKICTAARDSMG